MADTGMTEIKDRPTSWLERTIARLQDELYRRKKVERATAPATTPEGRRVEAQLAEMRQHNAAADARVATIFTERMNEARLRWATRRLASEYLKRHGWPQDDDSELAEIFSEVSRERDRAAAAYFSGGK